MSKRRRGGNGYSGRQWFYVLVNIPFLFIIKQGITKDRLGKRIRAINKSAIGWDIPIFVLKVRFAWNIENYFKKLVRRSWLFRWLKVPAWKIWGSGKTERFFIPMILLSVPTILIAFVIEWAVIIGLLVGFCYISTLKQ